MKKFLMVVLVMVLVSGLFLGGHCPSAQARSGADFYKGKTIKFLVPSSPGSGLDTVARILSTMLEKETGATLVVINRPGGGYTIPINLLYDKPDTSGLTISMVDMPSAVTGQLIELPRVRFDLKKMNWICTVNSGDTAAIVPSDSPYKTVADLLKAKQLTAAATGPTSPTGLGSSIILRVVMGLPVKVVTGYAASPAMVKAVVQKEVDIAMTLYAAAASSIKAGMLGVPFVWNPERFRVMPEVPTIYEELEKTDILTPEKKFWLDTVVNLVHLQRGVITSPNVQPDNLKYLRDAMAKIVNSPAVGEKFDKLGYTKCYYSGEETAKRVNKILSTDPALKAQLKKMLEVK